MGAVRCGISDIVTLDRRRHVIFFSNLSTFRRPKKMRSGAITSFGVPEGPKTGIKDEIFLFRRLVCKELILPAIDVAIALQPEWIIIENVKHMQHTKIPNNTTNRNN